MKVAAIIPTLAHKNYDYLKLAVESLRATTDWDIIVVTNGDKAKPDLSGIKGITIHLHTRDQGQCNAVNIGAQVVGPNIDYLFISNDDMYFAPGWNKNLQFNYPVLSPNLVEPVDNMGSAQPFLKIDGGFVLSDFDQKSVDKFIESATNTNKGSEESGFNFPVFIRKDVWDTIGGYDVAYDPWGSGSDTDLQMKIELAGIMPLRLRDVLVYHFSNKSGTFDGTHQDYWQNNWEYLEDKWGANRDQLNSDTWYCKNMLPPGDILKYRPDWMGKYENT